jgi:MoxR-like ATPase
MDRDVKDLLEGLKLHPRDFDAYADAFSKQRITNAAALVSLTPAQLYDCGVRIGHLAAFAEAIRQLKARLDVVERRERAAVSTVKPKRRAIGKSEADKAVRFIHSLPQVIATLSRDLIGLDEQCGLMVLAVLCKEHCLLLGPPGVAKSTLCERLFRLFDVPAEEHDSAFFHRLLTRFTLPDELFGPVSLQLLKEDQYQRNTYRYLPQARVAFLDEIFKSNSAILNALLTILNERMFDNGVSRSKVRSYLDLRLCLCALLVLAIAHVLIVVVVNDQVPLMVMIAASNEYPPDSGELQALYDRFLFRSWIDPTYSLDSFAQLLTLPYDADQGTATRSVLPLAGTHAHERRLTRRVVLIQSI